MTDVNSLKESIADYERQVIIVEWMTNDVYLVFGNL